MGHCAAPTVPRMTPWAGTATTVKSIAAPMNAVARGIGLVLGTKPNSADVYGIPRFHPWCPPIPSWLAYFPVAIHYVPCRPLSRCRPHIPLPPHNRSIPGQWPEKK